MSLRDVSTQSTALVESLRVTFQQIGKLSKEPNDELAQDIHESLKHHEEALELLQQDVQDFRSVPSRTSQRESERSRETARLAAQAVRLGEDLKHARSQFRRAQLSARRAAEAAKRAEGELRLEQLKEAYAADKKPADGGGGATVDLFAGRRSASNKQLTEDELIANTSSDITAALRQTHDQLTSELSRSRFAQETLVQSTAALVDLGERYSNLDTLLTTSRNLLGTLVKSQKSDTWYLETAFYVLVATLSWLVFRRFIYGPAWWFLWLPVKHLLLQPLIFLIRTFGGSEKGVADLAAKRGGSSLRVQPSAVGGAAKFPPGYKPKAVPVGQGGLGAKVGPDGSFVTKEKEGLVEQIGRMVEESEQQRQQQQQQQQQQQGQAGEGDQPEVLIEKTLHWEEEQHGTEGERRGEVKGPDQVIKRADGTVLRPRGETPVNPKKRMLEEPEQRERDEL